MTKTSSSSRINSRRKKNRLSVYDFSNEDEHIEKQSRKILQLFKELKPKKFYSSEPVVDKYCFLSSFQGGIRSSQNDAVSEILHIDDREDVPEKLMLDSGAIVTNSSSKWKPSSDYCLDSEGDTSGAKPSLARVRPGCSIADGKSFSGRHPLIFVDNEPVILDSDDDTKIESSKPDGYLPENKGSGNQQELMENPILCDTEIPVVVKPDHIMYGDMCSTNSILTFSCNSIKLEGSSSFGIKSSFTHEWSLCDIVSINSLWCKSVKNAIVDLHLKCKDAEVAIADNENSGAVVLKFVFYDPDWYETQEAIKTLDVRYKDKWNDIMELDSVWSYSPFFGEKSLSDSKHFRPNSSDNFEEIIYPEGDPDAICISKRDVDLLQPMTFINDTIIDFFIMYLKNKMNPEEKDRFHFFNSFFFRKLADLDKDPTSGCEGRAAFQRVRRWTAKVNIFGKDFIFIPVNFSLHWTLLVICHPGEVATFREEEMEKSSRVPCILHMDSIRGSHKGLKNLIRSYLLEEWRERHKEVTEDVATKFLNLPFVCLKLPQQDNSFDCGLFLLHYVELFLEEAPVDFNPTQITAPSKFLTEDWFSTEDVACKREYIKGLISEITKKRGQKVSPAHFDVEEQNTCMNFLQATPNTREACHDNDLSLHAGAFVTVSPVTNLIRGLQSAAVSEVVSGDLSLARDSAKPLTDDNYRHYGQKAQRNLFSNVMSPIEEEAIGEQMSISPAVKAGSQHIEPFAAPHASCSSKSETLLGRIFRSPDTGKVTPVCQSNGRGSPNSLDVEEEKDLRAKEEEVPSPDAAKYDSSEELAGYIVLDSQEEDENHDMSGLANNLPTRATTSALIHKEVDDSDIYDHNVNEKLPSSQLLEQAAKKPRHVPDVIEVSSYGRGKDKFVSLSTSSEEVEICFVQDSEEVNSHNLKPATVSGNDFVTGKTRHLFRYPRRVRIDLSEDLIVHH